MPDSKSANEIRDMYSQLDNEAQKYIDSQIRALKFAQDIHKQRIQGAAPLAGVSAQYAAVAHAG
jgi:hypothetical protein